jgi:hypothetical protein
MRVTGCSKERKVPMPGQPQADELLRHEFSQCLQQLLRNGTGDFQDRVAR